MKPIDKRKSGESIQGWPQQAIGDSPSRMEGTVHSPLPRVQYVPTNDVDSWLRACSSEVLAVIHYDQSCFPSHTYPVFSVALPQLNGCGVSEVWTSSLPVEYRRQEGLCLAANKQVMFGYLHIEETKDLGQASYEAYCRLVSHTLEMGYPHLLRIWNYFPGINSLVDGLERYQHFCVGRYQALAEHFSGFPHALPAGTAVGTKEGPLQLYFLAAVQPGLPIENPRQVSAYRYPPEYGPRSPSFARATMQRSEFGSQLFISGTASVVGHATQHAEHPAEQAAETIANLKSLMDQAEIECGRKIHQRMGTYKVYVRHAQDVDRIRDILHAKLSAEAPQLWLQGHLCRRDLLLEIEAVVPLHH